jgi:hypothetical protein
MIKTKIAGGGWVELGHVFNPNRGNEKCIKNFCPENPKEGDHLGDLGLDGGFILTGDVGYVKDSQNTWLLSASDRHL